MTPFEEFEALDRIFNVIKSYRQQKEDPRQLMPNDSVKTYLAKHLLAQDLHLWLRLEAQDALSDFLRNTQTNRDFKQLLGQFKGAAHGLVGSWNQSHSLN